MRKQLLAAAWLGATSLVCQAEIAVIPTISEQQVREFARARLDDGYQLLLGPSVPEARLNRAETCHALYQQRQMLMRQQLDYQKPFWDEPRHVAAAFVGAIWTPAFYYLPYRAVAAQLAQEHAGQTTVELDALRQASAELRCFER